MSEPHINRRELLGLAAGSAAFLACATSRSGEPTREPPAIVDTNINLFHWPFRRLPCDATEALVEKLRSLGIAEAWAGSFEGLFHRDLASANQRLAEECRRNEMLVPFGSVNVTLPDWERDLKACLETHRMPGVRLTPNYHGYALTDPRFAKLLKFAASAECLVQIAVALEDVRTQPEKLAVPDVDLAPLPDVMSRHPQAKVQLLNYRPQPASIAKLAQVSHLSFDVARIEGTRGVPQLVEQVSKRRVLFGSHAPFLIPEAALIRMHESSLLKEEAMLAILSGNARTLLRGSLR